MSRRNSCIRARQRRAAVAAGLLALVGGLFAARLSSSAEPEFSNGEIERIRALGPWPPDGADAWRPDPSNRVSGHSGAVDLGRRLFFDARLSGRGTHSCSSCHRPETAWSDGRPVAKGLEPSRRNTPSLLDVRYRRWFGWDGAADSLWAQSLRPILDAGEMGSSAVHVHAHIVADANLATAYAEVFGRAAANTPHDDVLVDAAKALAAYQETLVSPRTPFDALRDHLSGTGGRERSVADIMSASARRGLKLFVGSGGCDRCHGGPSLGSDLFVRIQEPSLTADSKPDGGRLEGLARLALSPFNAGGRFNDSTVSAADAGSPVRAPRTSVQESGEPPVGRDSDRYAFRVPPLRGVSPTAPYMHDGSVPTLAMAVAHPVPAAAPRLPSRRALTAAEIADLVAFLRTLGPP